VGKYIHRPHVKEDRAMRRASRRAAERGVSGNVTKEDWAARVMEFCGSCAYCLRTDRPLHRDHVIALNSGGAHHIDNLVPACKPCNSRKRDRGVLVMVGA
jgi:5-methylcytosine-specific restriction endonuclease McrA